ncbi:DUF4062 domain-containing protein [Rhodoplanes serenus]|uniref:DUF4062 domain-containing protein n=1 Tax=Rhodoplanes serenus TaxID=200615 RepID=A0A9X4XML3_9BRAD|nr:DUF4062 domain-containing protein [Rhodoplanes serenus]MTW17950.1 DUF4062 domain-containing protein [Rhodoplanes serenus]
MPRTLTEYRVFIGSPGGLDEERKGFRATIDRFNEVHGNPTGVVFAAVGWEETLGGVGRPQALINEDLRGCDYAVFVLHDRWGSPTGNGKTSGTEEEWDLALELYAANTIRNIGLFFKDVDAARLRDAGPQLIKVLDFKKAIEAERKHLFKAYGHADEFCDTLERHLARWLRDHGAGRAASLSIGPDGPSVAAESHSLAVETAKPGAAETAAPSLAYWLGEAKALLELTPPDAQGALFCAERAVALATNDVDWAGAENLRGAARLHLNDLPGAIETFEAIVVRLDAATTPAEQERLATALFNKGATLSVLGRSDEAIALYDEVIARFGSATEPALREPIAKALVNKGVTLGAFKRGDEAIAAYDDVIARFGSAPEPEIKALVDKAQLWRDA